jgi:hypothetical protein
MLNFNLTAIEVAREFCLTLANHFISLADEFLRRDGRFTLSQFEMRRRTLCR